MKYLVFRIFVVMFVTLVNTVVISPAIAGGVSLVGTIPYLIDKVNEIVSGCGSVVVSARSHRGSRSNHPLGRAVDVQGNPTCIYSHLRDWPGGYSMDYNSAPGGKHVHISYNPGGQEWGIRFVHRHGYRRYVSRHRHGRHYRRYAVR